MNDYTDNPEDLPPGREPPVPAERERYGLLPLTLSQRRGMLTIVGVMCVVLFVLLLRDSTTIADPQPDRGARAEELLAGIDPNTADEATIAALPTLGPSRARAIVRMRATLGRPYEKPEDLMAVPGIGAATVEQIRPYLRFSSTRPTTEGMR